MLYSSVGARRPFCQVTCCMLTVHLGTSLPVVSRRYAVALVLSCVGLIVACSQLLHSPAHPDAWWLFACCGLVGLCNALLFLQIAQYYTDYLYEPVRRIAAASTTGHGTNIIIGIAVGLESTGMAVLCTGTSILLAYHIGNAAMPSGGLFGTSVATMGMLSSAVYVLAMDTFGPIADNAGGIVEMSDQPEIVRDITDRLDAVGNVTKAATKGYSIGSAGLACFLLFSAFMDVVHAQAGLPFKVSPRRQGASKRINTMARACLPPCGPLKAQWPFGAGN